MIDYIPGGSVDVHAELKPFQIKQYDNNSHKLYLTVIDRDNPFGKTVNLEGHTVTAYFRLPDGSDEYVVCEIVKAKTGRIAVPFPGSVTQQIGTVQCEIRITGSGMSIISMRKFTFEVIESIYDSSAMEASESFSALDALISQAQGYRNELDSLQAELDGLGLDEIRAQLETIAAGLTTAQEEIAGLESLIATREEFLSLFDRSYDVTSSGGETGGDTPVVITAPSAPANVTATAGDSNIAISWSAVAGAEYYAVERTTNGGASWTTIASNITGTNYTDSTAVAGTSYRYAVTAYRTVGSDTLSSTRSSLSTAASLQETPVEETPPAAPANVTALWNASEGKVYVSWASVSGVSYTLERKAGSGAWESLNLTSANSYTDSSVTAGTTYQYRVTAHKGSLSSDPATVSMTVPNSGGEPGETETAPATPGNFTAYYNPTDGKVYISWNAVTGATSYTLRKNVNGTWSQLQSSSTRNYTDSSVTVGASYQYEVTANKTGSSGQTLSSSAVTVNVDIPSSGTSSLTPAQQVVKNIKVGWNLANSLDATYGDVKYEAKLNYSGDDNEGLVYATGWGLPDTTQEILRTVRNKGFNAIRIPITWNHHIRAANDNADVTISAPFMSYVKGVVDNALNVGFDYIIINTHHDASQYSWGKSIDMSATTGLHWTGCPTPYQLFFTTEQETTETQDIHNKMCIHMKKLWKAIATEFSDSKYNDHLIYEGFNEILGSIHRDSANGWNYPSSDKRKEGKDGYDVDEGWVIEQTNNLNKAFVEGVRSAGGNNLTRVLSCQHYGGQDWLSGQVVGNFGFDITNPDGTTTNSADDGHIILQIHSYWNSPFTIAAGAKQNLQSVNYKYPLIIGEVGWNRGASSSALDGQANAQIYYGSGENKTYLSASDFCDQMVRLTAAEGAKVFWWDNGRYTHSSKVELLGLLDRSNCTWYREAAANALINAANAVSDSGGNSGGSGDDSGNSGDSTTDTTPTAPTSVTATAGNGKNTITWSGATNAQYYTLERKEGGNAWVTIVSNYTGTSYTDTNVTGGISYQYRVTAHRMGTSGNVLSSSAVQSTAITAQTSTGDNWPTAAEIVNDIKVGWTLAGALDCTYEKVKTNEINTDSEGLAYEKGWGNPETTEYTFKAVKEMGFNAVRIPVTWNHHLRSAGNDNITISSYFLDRVKRVVKWAYDEGLYVVINSHYDTAAFSSSQSNTYASSTTGLTWNTAIPYQLFNADSTPSNSTQCGYIAKLWTQIATAFKDYGYRLMFEGFHEIQGNPRNNSAPTSDQIANVNALNNAFINAVRAVSGNEQRTLLCQTYNALNSGDAVTGFNVVNSGYEILDIKLFTDDTSTISGITSTLTSKGYPVVFGTSGWSTAPSGDNANFARTFAQAVKNAGARLFWWDDCGSSYKLLDRTATNAQISGSLWTRLSTAQALVEGSGGNHGTGLCIASDTTGTIGGKPITKPQTATEVVNNIKIGWNLGNTLDCSHDVVHIYEDPYDHTSKRVLGTEYEGVGYETGWGDTPVVTQAMLEAVVNAGFNAIRIPVTWAHHLRDEALPYDWGADKEWTTEIEEYPNLSGNIIISPYFLNRVKTIVNYALNAGFQYVILNSHWDTADYNNGKPFGYAKKVTGVPWITEIPYQFFHASKQLGSTLSAQYPNMTADDDYNNMLGYMRQMWTLIANAFKDYDYRLIFEGFNEILAFNRIYKEPEAIHVSRTNGFNEAFINAVRATGGNNADRVLSCETFAAYGSNNALNGFTLPSAETSADRIILQTHYYNNSADNFQAEATRVASKGIPAIFGEVGWSTNSGTPSDLYNFGYNLVQEAKSAGVKVFWWDNNKEGTGTNYYGLLNRWNTDSNNAVWHKPALLKGLIKGSGQTIDWIENISV